MEFRAAREQKLLVAPNVTMSFPAGVGGRASRGIGILFYRGIKFYFIVIGRGI